MARSESRGARLVDLITLRCTKRLLDRMKARPNADPPPPSSALGDWYANLAVVRRVHYVLAVSERSLLPVVLPAAPIGTLVPRFLDAASDVLRALGVPEARLARERGEMDDVTLGRTANRQVLGTLNDFGSMLDAYLEGTTCLAASLHLADAPCSPIAWERPRDKAAELLADPMPRLRLVK